MFSLKQKKYFYFFFKMNSHATLLMLYVPAAFVAKCTSVSFTNSSHLGPLESLGIVGTLMLENWAGPADAWVQLRPCWWVNGGNGAADQTAKKLEGNKIYYL